ncbi:hypothetical protein D3C80_1875210 [compost metagenome]
MCYIGAGRVIGAGIQSHTLGHFGGNLVWQQIQLPSVSLAVGLGQSQFIRACFRLVAKDLTWGITLLIDHTVGDDKHGVLLFLVLSLQSQLLV